MYTQFREARKLKGRGVGKRGKSSKDENNTQQWRKRRERGTVRIEKGGEKGDYEGEFHCITGHCHVLACHFCGLHMTKDSVGRQDIHTQTHSTTRQLLKQVPFYATVASKSVASFVEGRVQTRPEDTSEPKPTHTTQTHTHTETHTRTLTRAHTKTHPNVELDVLVCDSLYIESHSGYGSHTLPQLQLVEDGYGQSQGNSASISHGALSHCVCVSYNGFEGVIDIKSDPR